MFNQQKCNDKVLHTEKLQGNKMILRKEDDPKHVSEAKMKVNRMLPEGYKSLIVTATYKLAENGYEEVYGCVRLSIASKADAMTWIKKFELKTLTSYSVQNTWQKDPVTGLFKNKFLCNYYTSQPGHCKACLIFTIKDTKEIEANPDYYLRDYPSQVVLQFCHNHKVDAEACFRNVRPLTELHQTFQAYYQTGHSPFSALVCHKCDLHSLYGSEFYNVVSSKFMCPPYNWCCQEYFKLFNKNYICPRREELEEKLQTLVGEYNKQCGSECAVLKDKNLTLCSPLMKRVFELGFAEDLVTIRCFNSSKLAPEAYQLFVFLCHTPIGSLPFGVMVIKGTESSIVQQGISTLLQMLRMPSYSPKQVIINENSCLFESLKLAFPKTKLIFDEFQMLQSIWKVVRLVCENHQEFQLLYNQFVIMLNSHSPEDYQRNFNTLRTYSVKYPKLDNFLKYFNRRAKRYVLYCRQKADFNHYADSGTIILRDVKYSNQFNIVQLFDFLTKNYVNHYERKLKKIVDGDLKGFYKSNFYVPPSRITEYTCEKITNTEFQVSLNGNHYFVNAELDTCTCDVRGSCVHQYIVEKNLGLVPECYTPLGEDMLEIFRSIISYKNLNNSAGESDYCIEETEEAQDLQDTSCYDKSSGELDLNSTKNGQDKIKILSSIIIKPKPQPERVTFEASDLVNRLSLAFSQLSKLAATNKFQEPIEKFLDKFQELASTDRLISALQNFGQSRFPCEFEHYSDCESSCSEFHSELEETDPYFPPVKVQENIIKLPAGIRLTRITQLNKSEEVEQMSIKTEDVGQPHDDLSFLFNDPRFEAIVEDDPISDQEELKNPPPSPLPLPTAPIEVQVQTSEPKATKTPKASIKPNTRQKLPRLRTKTQKPRKTPKHNKKKLTTTPPNQPTSTKKESDSDDSEILNSSPLMKQKPENQKSNLELIVLLERNINIELLCKAKELLTSTKKKRRGYKELLETAKKIKYL